jgi:RNA:NAD 2'-phosphotransferase (TPT1/KptA family)/8-oxo-dGTP pyrophosphatase MutT (NUDIX family)
LAIDTLRLRKTLAFLLRHRPDVGRLEADSEGWYDQRAVARAASRLMRSAVGNEDLVRVVQSDPRGGFELDAQRVRAVTGGKGTRRRRRRVPDILYLPATQEQLEAGRGEERFPLDGRRSFRLHAREQDAWVAAHRRSGGQPVVIYVEASRALRAGVTIRRAASGQYTASQLPTRFLLNARPGFGLQSSAGGFLVRRSRGGRLQVGLVRVRRRSGVTWEVAKGKSELGETPRQTAIRELQEEMGIDTPLEIVEDLGVSHYGFSTPSGEPRLKLLHLFILRPLEELPSFSPARPEGIEQVAFFDGDAAVRVVSHGSLREPVRRLRRWMRDLRGSPLIETWPIAGGAQPGPDERVLTVDDAGSSGFGAGEE